MKGTQVVLGFDMETDVGSFTPFYEGLVHGTPVILDILAKLQVSAAFFFTGDSARAHPEVVVAVSARAIGVKHKRRPVARQCGNPVPSAAVDGGP